MPLPTFNNGESNASVRTKINNCITQVNDLVANPLPVVLPIDFENGSFIDAGDPAYGSNSGGGIEQVCAADYRQRWEGGRLWFYDQNASGVREVRMNFGAPTVNDDSKASLRFRVGSRWIHEDGRTWVCRNSTIGAAIWDLVSSQPDVIYVTTKGNDTSGDGTITNPFLTLQKVYDQYLSIGMSIAINLGTGSYSAIAPTWASNAQITGAGCNLTYVDILYDTPLGGSAGSFDIRADHCTITAAYTGLDGENGVNGNPNGDQNGTSGGDGSSGGSITIEGLCHVATVSTKGGNGGNGGNGVYDSNGEGGGNGGVGGIAGSSGQITLQVLKVSGSIDASGGTGGSGGTDGSGQNQANSGSSGNGSSIYIDGTDARTASTVVTGASYGEVYIARCSYSASLGTIDNDLGGNALY